MTAREVVSLLFRYRNILLVCLYLPLLLGIAKYLHERPTYIATAKILISSFQDSSAQNGLDQSSSNSAPQTTKQEIINSELEILKSSDMLDAVIQHFGADTLFPRLHLVDSKGNIDPDRSRIALATALVAGPVKNSNVIEISYEAGSPQLAQQVLSWIVSAYQERHAAAFSIPVASFLDTQLATMDHHIQDVDTAEATYKSAHDLYNADQQRQQILGIVNNLTSEAVDISTHSAELRSRIIELQKTIETIPQTVESYAEAQQSDATSHAQQELLDLQVQEKQLAAHYNDSAVPLKTVRDQIATIRSFLDVQSGQFSGSVRTSRNPLYDEMQAEIVRAQIQLAPDDARAAAIAQQIDALNTKLHQLEEAQIHIAALERERDSTADTEKIYRQRQLQASVIEQLNNQQSSSIRIIQEATAVEHPIKPVLLSTLGTSLGIGFLLSLIIAVVIFATRNTFIVPEGLERAFKIPVIASLPLMADGFDSGLRPGGLEPSR